MKTKILLLAACLGFSGAALSQRTGIGIKGGYNLANLSISDNGRTSENNSTSSFNLGAYLDLGINRFLSVQPGLVLSGKGAKYVTGNRNSNTWTEVRMKPLYLELPVNAVIKLPLGGKKNLFAGAGPYLAVGVGGKNTIKGELLGVDYESKDDITWGSDNPSSGSNGSAFRGNLKRYDMGLNFLAGVQAGLLTFNAQYGLGFTDIRPGADNGDNERFKNRVLSLSVGVLF